MLNIINRANRVGKELKKEISLIIQNSLRDPRLNNIITISDVRLSQDCNNAKVFVSFLNEKEEFFLKSSIKILNHASSFIRLLLSKKMQLRVIPSLFFIYDRSFITGMHINNLIRNSIKK